MLKKLTFSIYSANLPTIDPCMNISVLSLGWEYPPNLEGGLGIAYLGLNKALSQQVTLRGIVPGIEVESSAQNESFQVPQTAGFPVSPVRVSFPLSSYASSIHLIEKPVSASVHENLPLVPPETSPLFEDIFEEHNTYQNPHFESIRQFADKVMNHTHDWDVDLIHTHDWMTFLAAFQLKTKYNCPVVLHIHSLEFDRSETPWDSWIFELERRAMEAADALIAVSQYTRDIMVNEYEVDPEKITIVHNGIEPIKGFRHPKAFPEPLILFLGRLTFQKGPELFVEMAKQILRQKQDVRFVVGGKGDQLPEIVRFVAEAKIGDKVHFTGHLSRQKVYDLFAMADIFVMPSVSEPFGLVALEAAQFDLPCVISQNSGVAEIFPASSQADPSNPQQWVDAVMGLLQFPEWRKEQAQELKSRVQDLTWEKAAEKTVDVFRSVLS